MAIADEVFTHLCMDAGCTYYVINDFYFFSSVTMVLAVDGVIKKKFYMFHMFYWWREAL
jgi:hypothetical protein